MRLLLPGHGPHEPSVRHFAGTTGYDSEILFTGDDVSLEDALAAADIVLLLGQRDTSPSALAAAMAAGSAVAASRTPAATVLLRDGESAMLTPLGDPRRSTAAILKLCDSPELRRRLGESAAAVRETRGDAARVALQQMLETVTQTYKGLHVSPAGR